MMPFLVESDSDNLHAQVFNDDHARAEACFENQN